MYFKVLLNYKYKIIWEDIVGDSTLATENEFLKIAKRIKNNEDLFGRNIKYEKIAIDESFPKYIFNNKAMFKEWII